ncbi:uncharacterized protein Bfra_002760 [Botrytis fragariae]|uniref:Uncharacterized protein n=1 Tax=Botrytis fragariae TaxID=1964551 RepID=A0A8H6AZL9_9HELO|nr:uncharacterized protein Bfra_002760 [Botrytis fragariae]KAF5876355.1 hypothetical protein Bfra_002760 [Botrytis fragariae]
MESYRSATPSNNPSTSLRNGKSCGRIALARMHLPYPRLVMPHLLIFHSCFHDQSSLHMQHITTEIA